jgi:exosortase family protein XrtG
VIILSLLGVIIFIIWIYVLTVTKRGKLDFWHFIIGSVGLFIFMLFVIEPLVVEPLERAVSVVAGMFGDATGIYEAYYNKSIIFITSKGSSISMYVDFECSGVVEIMAFLSLVGFFQIYNVYEKIVVAIVGQLVIFLSNVLRIFVICFVIHLGGVDSYYIAHSIVGRMVFYVCTITLYFVVFTKAQFLRQRVGGIRYETDKSDIA